MASNRSLKHLRSDAALEAKAADLPPVMQAVASLPKYPIIGDEVSKKLVFDNLLDLMGSSNRNAILSADGRAPLTHRQLKDFVTAFDLTQFGVYPGDRCGLMLPNGPELSVAVLCLASRCCTFPVNPQNTHGEILADMKSVDARAMIVQDGQNNDHLIQVALDMNIPLISLYTSPQCGKFSLGLHDRSPKKKAEEHKTVHPGAKFTPRNGHALVLHTSGTSGKKKIVPYSLETIVVGATCILMSWELRTTDINTNMMPLFHIGGIARNLFAVVFSGSAVVCAPGFDASLFWDIAQQHGSTWYYAGPTMHQMICEEAKNRGVAACQKISKIRLIANAAGALLPAVAEEMKRVFGCAVLPGYGMTECMPISAPPTDYQLDRPGCSGRAIGPQLDILNDKGEPVEIGKVGNIVIKGSPLFGGYEGDEQATANSFFANGWFNTGDLGYFDKEKYVYITGRSKEVINRGGEIISPFEVEEAFTTHPRIKTVMCFACPHNTLEEAIGLVVVTKNGMKRPDINELTRFAGEHLHPSKWPFAIVYMDDLPKNGVNKVLRIKFASRCGMSELNDTVPISKRTFEATCPPIGTALTEPIPDFHLVRYEAKDVEAALQESKMVQECFVMITKVKRQTDAFAAYVTPKSVNVQTLSTYLKSVLHDYQLPASITPMDSLPKKGGQIDIAGLPKPGGNEGPVKAASSQLEEAMVTIWQEVLDMKGEPISADADFFALGGNSLLAGKLAAKIRNHFNVALSVAAIFNNKLLSGMAGEVAKQTKAAAASNAPAMERRKNFEVVMVNGDEQDVTPSNPSHPCNLLVQLLPVCILYPFRRAGVWIAWVYIWLGLMEGIRAANNNQPLSGLSERLYALVISAICVRVATHLVLPWIGIATKWIVIGRYKQGRYSVHGSYYLRWWFVNQVLRITGKGCFLWWSGGLVLYYRLLGSAIGKNVKIHRSCKVSEYDLLCIKDGACLDADVLLRPMCLDRGTLTLKKIKIGRGVSVAFKTQIAPGTNVRSGTCFGPLSSSYELADCKSEYRALNTTTFPGPPLILKLIIGYPIIFLVDLITYMPTFGILVLLALSYPSSIRNFDDAIQWFTLDGRIGYYFLLRIVRGTLQPLVRLTCCWLIKKFFIGKFTPGPRVTAWVLFRVWLMATLMPDAEFHGIAGLCGKHYETVSRLYRLFGAKIGKRVYWPGSGFKIVEYDLFEVGDDVVFGSRSTIQVRDAKESRPIVLKNSANIADRCVLLPGVTVGECAVLGSGALGKKNHVFPRGSVSVGSRGGKAEQLTSGSDAPCEWSTFGKAFYGKEAKYFVLPEWFVILYNVLWHAFVAALHAGPIIGSIFLTYQTKLTVLGPHQGPSIREITFEPFYLLLIPIFCGVYSVSMFVFLFMDWSAKWIVVGRRKPGSYSWLESSYCQRWQMYLTFNEIRRSVSFGGNGILDFFTGTQFLVWWFRALGCNIGNRVCLYPNGGDPMMTEPDLITLEDNVCVDDASLIGHMNTKGVFSLNNSVLQKGATMRTMSRLLAGATLESDATLLEHTLVYAGDAVPAGTMLQGWPPEVITSRQLDKTVDIMTTLATMKKGRLQDSKNAWDSVVLSKLGLTMTAKTQGL